MSGSCLLKRDCFTPVPPPKPGHHDRRQSSLGTVMTDPYCDTDLVALYDVDNPAGVDHDYYRPRLWTPDGSSIWAAAPAC